MTGLVRGLLRLYSPGFESPCQVKHKHKDFLTACEKGFEGREMPNNTVPPPHGPATKYVTCCLATPLQAF